MIDISEILKKAAATYSPLNNVMWFSTNKGGVMGVATHIESPVQHDFITSELKKNKIPFEVRKSATVCYDPIISIQEQHIGKLAELCPVILKTLDENSEIKAKQREQRIEAAQDYIASHELKSPDRRTTDPSSYFLFSKNNIEQLQAIKKHMRELGIEYSEANGGDRVFIRTDGHENYDKLNYAVNQSILRKMERAENAVYDVFRACPAHDVPIAGQLLKIDQTNIGTLKSHLHTLGIVCGEVSMGGNDYLSISGEDNLSKFRAAVNCAARREIEAGEKARAKPVPQQAPGLNI